MNPVTPTDQCLFPPGQVKGSLPLLSPPALKWRVRRESRKRTAIIPPPNPPHPPNPPLRIFSLNTSISIPISFRVTAFPEPCVTTTFFPDTGMIRRLTLFRPHSTRIGSKTRVHPSPALAHLYSLALYNVSLRRGNSSGGGQRTSLIIRYLCCKQLVKVNHGKDLETLCRSEGSLRNVGSG